MQPRGRKLDHDLAAARIFSDDGSFQESDRSRRRVDFGPRSNREAELVRHVAEKGALERRNAQWLQMLLQDL